MKKIWVYFLILGAIIDLSLIIYINWPDNTPKLSYDDKFYASFKCPEDYVDEETRVADNERFIFYTANTHPNMTIDQFMEIRANFLIKKNCTETLQNMAENDEAEEKYYADMERELSIQVVSANSSSTIINRW